MASKHVKVVLSADGGDELFAGYNKYDNAIKNYNLFKKCPQFLNSFLSRAFDSIPLNRLPLIKNKFKIDHKYASIIKLLSKNISPDMVLKNMSQRINNSRIKDIFLDDVKELETCFDSNNLEVANNDNLNRLLSVDYQTFMCDDILTKVDRATMSVSIEGREPLLDHRLIEFMSQIPSKYKNYKGEKKYILKEIVHKYLPKSLMDRPKHGFGIPVLTWFRGELKDLMIDLINEKQLNDQKIFRVNKIIEIRDAYFRGRNDDFEFLWFMMIFQMWYNRWMKS